MKIFQRLIASIRPYQWVVLAFLLCLVALLQTMKEPRSEAASDLRPLAVAKE